MKRLEALKIELKREFPHMELREQEAMWKHTSFRIGGPVPLMALPGSEEEAVGAIRISARHGVQRACVGNGSNTLVADEGADYFILKMGEGMGRIERLGETCLRLGAGARLTQAANFALGEGLTGLEFAHGIPGSVGGAVMMNAGAYGGEMADVVTRVRWVSPEGEIRVFEKEELAFGYRKSVFEKLEGLILSAEVELRPGDRKAIQARIEDLAAKRREKQPLEYPNAGSTFKRPEGHFAAALIDQCGLKGYRVGGAQVSEKHAGFIINTGNATCADVRAVMAHVQEVVLREHGVKLEPEVRFLEG